MKSGAKGEFTWLESDSLDLHGFLRAVPEAVVGRPVAIASFDSGPLVPSRDERALGWESRDGVTYVPPIDDVSMLPYDQYDEWYILETRVDLGPIDTFVNYPGFGVSDPEQRPVAADAGWDLVGRKLSAEAERARQKLFWAHVARIRPLTCILDGDLFVVVTRDLTVVERLKTRLVRSGA